MDFEQISKDNDNLKSQRSLPWRRWDKMGKNQIVGKIGLFIDSAKISQILIGLLLCEDCSMLSEHNF